jgi:carbon monoxide dehydrogenase subunit G
MAVTLALAGVTFAGGIDGRVVDGNGNPRRGVTISAKGYRQTTTTDANGYYSLKMPSYADGTRVNVYVSGIFAVNCLVPPGNANSTVDVTLIRN